MKSWIYIQNLLLREAKMEKYEIELTLLSPTLIGSGERFGSLIDTDIVFDDAGIPFIPSKRIKGCLRDSAIEVCKMLKISKIKNFINLKELKDVSKPEKNSFESVVSIFGYQGQSFSAPIYFSNLFLENYEVLRKWFQYLINKYPSIFTREAIIKTFTEIRQQTAIEDGIAKAHSLRTIRVVREGLKFLGLIFFEKDDINGVKLLSLACANLRRFGTKRNRGFGEIICKLFKNSKEINFLNESEELCTQ